MWYNQEQEKKKEVIDDKSCFAEYSKDTKNINNEAKERSLSL